MYDLQIGPTEASINSMKWSEWVGRWMSLFRDLWGWGLGWSSWVGRSKVLGWGGGEAHGLWGGSCWVGRGGSEVKLWVERKFWLSTWVIESVQGSSGVARGRLWGWALGLGGEGSDVELWGWEKEVLGDCMSESLCRGSLRLGGSSKVGKRKLLSWEGRLSRLRSGVGRVIGRSGWLCEWLILCRGTLGLRGNSWVGKGRLRGWALVLGGWLYGRSGWLHEWLSLCRGSQGVYLSLHTSQKPTDTIVTR